MRRRAFSQVVLVVIFCIDLLAPIATARANTKIRVGLPDFTSSSVPFEIARQMGYFSQEGLDVEVIRMSCAVSVRALVARSIDFDSCAGVKAAVSAVSQGIRIKIVMARFNRPLMDLIGSKDIQKILDLAGKIIGSGSQGSPAEAFLEEFLTANGLNPQKDVKMLSVGTSSDRIAALFAKRIGATVLSPPWNLKVLDQGYRRIANMGESVLGYQGSLSILQSTADEKKPTLLAFLRAMMRAQNFYRTRRSESLPLMMQFSKLESSDLTQRVYDYLLPAMTMDGSLPDTVVEAEMQRAAKSLKLVKTPPAQEIFDFSYVREANRALAQK
ncbi:MAG TPA: ABC transporter substrate-binding protein [Verrucomicrobiae bacterium]|nr:ABC transporter substrate-binding protein [Verrucomicrobiae bacterium]